MRVRTASCWVSADACRLARILGSLGMNCRDQQARLEPRRSRAVGVSLLELVVSVAIILIITVMAIPVISRTLRTYQLNDAATQLASLVKFARFEAIRLNKPVICVNSQAAPLGPASLWADSDGDGIAGATEKQILLGPNATLIAAGSVPNPGALAVAVQVSSLTAINPGSDGVKFDQRGAVIANPSAVYVYYLGNPSETGGYRAVVILPSGSVQVWTYSGGSKPWQQVS
jgi:Tfp pilus assembly protein FimT